MIVAIEAVEQGVTAREDTESGMMFANDFVGILLIEAPEGSQKQGCEELLIKYTRKWE